MPKFVKVILTLLFVPLLFALILAPFWETGSRYAALFGVFNGGCGLIWIIGRIKP